MKESKFLNLKQFILAILMSVLIFGLSLAIAMPLVAVPNPYVMFFCSSPLCGLILGIPYVFMVYKAPKIGTAFILHFIMGLYFLLNGGMFVFVLFTITGLISEAIMLNGGYQSKVRLVIPFVLLWIFNNLNGSINILFFRDTYVQTYMSMGMDEASADLAIQGLEALYLAPLNIIVFIALTTVFSILGYFIGTKMLKKHFKPAGAV